MPEWLDERTNTLVGSLPRERRVIENDDDENAGLGIWLLRDGQDGVLLVREWTL